MQVLLVRVLVKGVKGGRAVKVAFIPEAISLVKCEGVGFPDASVQPAQVGKVAGGGDRVGCRNSGRETFLEGVDMVSGGIQSRASVGPCLLVVWCSAPGAS
eukprot:9652122-Heterocapsa_arctica.AAC.1